MEITVRTTDMHTGGEPVRIVESGYADIPGANVLEKRRYVSQNLDHLRKFVMYEPRGHKDMYGVVLLPPSQNTDVDVLFMHNEGYSTMCGHATIAIARYCVEKGFVSQEGSNCAEIKVVVGCPCGEIEAYYEPVSRTTRFLSVPAFVLEMDKEIEVPGYGRVAVDVSFGGTFYAVVSTSKFSLDINKMTCEEIITLASKITYAAKMQIKVSHPMVKDLSFIYGTILTDGDDPLSPSKTCNVAVFADNAVDRSPTGSGVTARMALLFYRNQVKIGQVIEFINPLTDSSFKGCVRSETVEGKYPAVVVEVSGKSFFCGTSTFCLEQGDELGKGFLIK